MEGLIRPALPDEHRLLSRIAFESKSYWPYSAEVIALWSAELSVSRASVESTPTFVLAFEGEVAGFYQLEMGPQRIELAHFWLRPCSMGQGLGRRLLYHACEQALTHGYDELRIDADPFAEHFYAACGATRMGSTPAPIPGQPTRQRPLMALDCHASRLT